MPGRTVLCRCQACNHCAEVSWSVHFYLQGQVQEANVAPTLHKAASSLHLAAHLVAAGTLGAVLKALRDRKARSLSFCCYRQLKTSTHTAKRAAHVQLDHA